MKLKLTCAMVVIAACAGNLDAASITEIPGLFDGKFRWIQQLMPDGNSVMGVAGNEVFRWTPTGGREILGLLSPDQNIIPTAISADGTTVVGRRIGNYSQEAIRWNADTGLEVLPTGGSHPFNPSPSQVSDDGSVVYGLSYKKFTQPGWDLYTLGLIDYPYFSPTEGNQEAKFRWQSSAGFDVLPSWLPDANEPFGDERTIRGISADGSAAGGVIGRAPVIWSALAGVQQPANLPTEFGSTNVDVVSADGTTVVGTYYATNCRFHPSGCTPGAIGVSAPILFRWAVGGEIELLSETEGEYFDAYEISSDGKTVLGFIATPQGNEGYNFIWRAGHGLENVLDYFASRGVVVPYAGYHSVVEMSRDGLVFTGETTRPETDANGAPTYHSTRWIVDLRAVPEPGSLIQLMAVALSLTFVGARRRT